MCWKSEQREATGKGKTFHCDFLVHFFDNVLNVQRSIVPSNACFLHCLEIRTGREAAVLTFVPGNGWTLWLPKALINISQVSEAAAKEAKGEEGQRDASSGDV